MTIHEVMGSASRQVLLTVFLLLMTVHMGLIFAAQRHEKRIRFLVGHFILGFIVFYLLMVDSYWWDLGQKAGDLPEIIVPFCRLPVMLVIVYEIVTAAGLLFVFFDLLGYRKNHPSSGSIKETMDLLPVGVMFGKPEGSVVFSNLTMNRVMRALLGKDASDLNDVRKTAFIDKESSKRDVTLPDGNGVWQLEQHILNVEEETYVQLTAVDVTKQTAIVKELEEKNSKLRELQMRLSIYNRQADRIIIAQELLTARMAVHNELGNVLLESRHYMKDPSSFDEEKLLQALKNTNTYLLKEYEEDDTESDPLVEALDTADAIGVDVTITGVIPSEDPYRMILAAAIKECASNTIKHADGDSLLVDVQTSETEIIFTLCGNGRQPEKEVRETGGLLSLRTLVENKKGTMRTGMIPEYHVQINLPKNEN
ncbi:MAG: hypothetical protein IJ252_06395 [Solobacterium sp.]|nr:hypothetical protein [Solobacterium sp.]